MALISVTLNPDEDVRSFDFRSEGVGSIAGFGFDGVNVYLATHVPAEVKDAGIVSAANLLIGVLVGLRDAAAQRLREEKAAHDAAWAAELDGTDAPLADPGDHHVGMPA